MTCNHFAKEITNNIYTYISMKKIVDLINITAFLLNNDERYFLPLYRKYTPMLYQFLLKSLNSNHYIVEEIIQETWVRVIQNLTTFKWRSSFKTWLFGIAINIKKEFLRENSSIKNEYFQLNPIPDNGYKPDSIDLDKAMATLPEGYKNIFILHDVQGFKHREIAEILGIEIGTSKSQLSRARSAMRKFLTEKN